MFKKFREDPNYLTKYHLSLALFLFCANVALYLIYPPTMQTVLWFLPAILLMTSTELKVVMFAVAYAWAVGFLQFGFSAWNMLAVIPAVVLTFPFTSWIHSASHSTIRPKWLNRPLGEFTAFIQMTGFPTWTVIHILHHQHSDTELDPHPPMQKTYWEFAFGMRAQVSQCIVKHYFRYFGQNETSMKRLRYFMMASRLDMAMKVSFWYLLLGPKFFTFLFLPAVLFKMLHYAWLNHATHSTSADGKSIVNNLDHGVYRFINMISSDMYYHGNHHNRPNFHNPKKIQMNEESESKVA